MLSLLTSLLALPASVAAQGFISMPLSRVEDPSAAELQSRAVSGPLDNARYIYTVDFTLGDQPQRAIIDTGSSDLWVFDHTTTAEFKYDPSNATFLYDGFRITYLDGTRAMGDYYKDRITWGNSSVDLQFAVTWKNPRGSKYGVFGIGFPTLEASVLQHLGEYDNYPQVLQRRGLIEAVAYSLDLNSRTAETGTLVFGAVDTSRYVGKLQLLDGQSKTRFAVKFSVANQDLVGVLDCGSTNSYLPKDAVDEIGKSLGAEWSNDRRAYLLKGEPPNKSVPFDFAGTIIEVPASELLLPLPNDPTSYFLSVMPNNENLGVILGESFLRSAYVVYHLDLNKIAIAQATHENGPSDFKVITAANIPGAEY